jgi:phospholipid/cholesterol/gamma-HCH transport system permease protein
MNIHDDSQSSQYHLVENEDGGINLRFRGRLDASNAPALIQALAPLLKDRHPPRVTVDLEKVTYLDDFGALVLVELKKAINTEKSRFHLINATDPIKERLSILGVDALGPPPRLAKKRPPNTVIRLGEATLRHASELKFLISFVGSISLSFFHVVFHPRSLRKDDTFLVMQRTGVDALPIVALISFLLGLIMAFMSAVQLRQFGANIYVASLVSLAMARELGPIMTAIVVAGRSGSAFAAEIATMKISEEVDALFTMGFDPIRFLVIPKLIASLVVVPLLVLFSDVFAIAGGLVVGVFMLDLTASAYIAQTIWTLTPFDILWGLLKSGVFAILITWIGCLRGFRVTGGAASVGQATTSAVVSSLFLIILFDSIFAVILRYWG